MTSLVNTIRSLYEKKEVEEVSIDEAFETLDLEESELDEAKIISKKPHPEGGHIIKLKTDGGQTVTRHLKNGKVKTLKVHESDELDEVLDSPKAMQSYRDKAKASKEKAASSAVAKMNKGMEKGHRVHPAGELKTIAKRAAGERMANKKVREEAELDEAKNKNPFKYYKKPSNKKEAQSNVNYWHYEGMLSTKDMEDMGMIPANYKSFIKTMKQGAERDLKKFQEEVDLEEAKVECPQCKGEGCDHCDNKGYHMQKDEAKMTDAKNKQMMRKALGVSKLGPKHAHYTTSYANNGDFVVRDGAGRVVGRITKDELNEDLKENYRMERMGVSRSLVDAVRNVLSGKPQEEALDKVNPDAVKKKFKDRNDKDIDNDGDVDDSDEYLHKRRQAVSKAIAKGEEKEDDKDVKNGKKEKVTIDPPLKEAQVNEISKELMKKAFRARADRLGKSLNKYDDGDKSQLKKAMDHEKKLKKTSQAMDKKSGADKSDDKDFFGKRDDKRMQRRFDATPQGKYQKYKDGGGKLSFKDYKAQYMKEGMSLDEAEMTDAQMKKREDIVKSMKKKKSEFIAKYGDRADDVMYATATKMAMKEAGPKLGTDSLKTMRAKDKAHADAMGRHVASGRKKSK